MKREIKLVRRVAMVGIGATVFTLFGVQSQAFGQKEYNGPGGGEFAIEDRQIKLVDGDGNWIIIKEKNGRGTFIAEKDNQSIIINKVDGPGQSYLRNTGYKKILTVSSRNICTGQGEF